MAGAALACEQQEGGCAGYYALKYWRVAIECEEDLFKCTSGDLHRMNKTSTVNMGLDVNVMVMWISANT